MPKLTPREILQTFKQHWNGTPDQLMTALEEFYTDIMHSVQLASPQFTEDQRDEVDDYLTNHYFD